MAQPPRQPIGEERPDQEQFVPIVKSVGEQKSDGSYFFAYEGADGSFREEVGIIKNAGTENEELEISGTYHYYDANGDKVEVSYVADKNGFVPQGTSIPKEISEAARSPVQNTTTK
ncbi:endocuticle structural protein SgAbd-6-like [Scaptodrosophila lebanonensis]|uniref:Endocuticle structural protein SgAbd-6-like n=1 Tax=Drosophila lebanonensis TaxID=7225 RepID=A0A6J2UF61_DROLE|nr:endocuticle structural protein SgAbd-6-like [Scaptodrosophila lebanonensis]